MLEYRRRRFLPISGVKETMVSTRKRDEKMERARSSERPASGAGPAGKAGSIKAFLSRVDKAGRQKVTIMLVPHTHRKVRSLQLSWYSLGALAFAACLVVLAFAFSAARFSAAANKLQSRSSDLVSTQAKLDAVHDQSGRLLTSVKRFQSALDGTLASAGADPADPPAQPAQTKTADLASGAADPPSTSESAEIGRAADALEGSVDDLRRLGTLLQNQDTVLTDIPTIWPVKGASHIAMYYGRGEDPFTGEWEINDGVNIATQRAGAPVLSAADGKVEESGYDSILGNFITVRHGHGFLTKYSHLMEVRASKGQKVKQGQVIGLLGNTGLSTGPCLLYEVQVGTSAIDPLDFLNVRAASVAVE